MKKFNLIIILLTILITSCVSDYDRLEDCRKKYKNSIVTPSTNLLARQGYEITVEDTITNQIYAISYYPFSSTKISSITNIR